MPKSLVFTYVCQKSHSMAGGSHPGKSGHALTSFSALHTSLKGNFWYKHIQNNRSNVSPTNKMLIPTALHFLFLYFLKHIVRSHSPGSCYFINNFREEHATLNIFCIIVNLVKCRRQLNKSASVLGIYGACEFSHTFPLEKPFNKLPSGHMFMTCI